jgi:hypothetical protein
MRWKILWFVKSYVRLHSNSIVRDHTLHKGKSSTSVALLGVQLFVVIICEIVSPPCGLSANSGPRTTRDGSRSSCESPVF